MQTYQTFLGIDIGRNHLVQRNTSLFIFFRVFSSSELNRTLPQKRDLYA